MVAERRGEFFGSCYDATCGNVFRFVGPYRFRVVAVNRVQGQRRRRERRVHGRRVRHVARGQVVRATQGLGIAPIAAHPGHQARSQQRRRVRFAGGFLETDG